MHPILPPCVSRDLHTTWQPWHCWRVGCLTLSLPSSKSTFFQPFKEKCISEVVGIGSIIVHLSKLWRRQVLHTVWCNISGKAAGEITLGSQRVQLTFFILQYIRTYLNTLCATTPRGSPTAHWTQWTSLFYPYSGRILSRARRKRIQCRTPPDHSRPGRTERPGQFHGDHVIVWWSARLCVVT